MTGLNLLLALIGLAFLYVCYCLAVWVSEAPLMPGEYSRLDHLDGLPRDVVEHEARMDARAARLGMPR